VAALPLPEAPISIPLKSASDECNHYRVSDLDEPLTDVASDFVCPSLREDEYKIDRDPFNAARIQLIAEAFVRVRRHSEQFSDRFNLTSFQLHSTHGHALHIDRPGYQDGAINTIADTGLASITNFTQRGSGHASQSIESDEFGNFPGILHNTLHTFMDDDLHPAMEIF
jgi:hypothetical protein